MKNIKVVFVVIAFCCLAGIASCGSGGGTSGPQGAVNAAASAFYELVNYYIDSCINFPCNCPGGGTIEAPATGELTLVNCQSSNGQAFNGDVTFNNDDSITFNFEEFGDQCSGVGGTVSGILMETCSGTVSGTCADEYVTCQMSTNCETCTI